MKRFIVALLAALAALCVTTSATAVNKTEPNPGLVIVTKCGPPKQQKQYTGRVIVKVSGSGCVTIDKGAVAIASGNAVVAAHGSSSVDARGNVTLIVYNLDVSCAIHGNSVTLISAIKGYTISPQPRCVRYSR